MKRYMLLSAFLLLMGMALRSTNDTSVVLAVFAVWLGAAVFCIWKGKTAAFIMCMIIPVVGFVALNINISHYQRLVSPLYNTECEAQCRVEGIYKYDDFAYIDVSARSITTCLGTYGETRKIRLCLYDDIPYIGYADIVKVKAILREPTIQTMSVFHFSVPPILRITLKTEYARGLADIFPAVRRGLSRVL